MGSKVGSNWNPPYNNGKSAEKAAKIVGVGTSSVNRAKYVKKHDPEVFKKIESGETTPCRVAAHRTGRHNHEQQTEKAA